LFKLKRKWFEEKALEAIGLLFFLAGLEMIRVLLLDENRSVGYTIFLGVATAALVLLIVYGYVSATAKGSFLGLDPRWFLIVPFVGYVVGVSVGLLLPF